MDEGGKFISRQVRYFISVVGGEVMMRSQLQVEVGEPVVQTVGNISNVIATSPFGNTVHRTVEVTLHFTKIPKDSGICVNDIY